MGSSQTYDDAIRVRLSSSRTDRLEEIAIERSEPGARVTPSHIVREAIDAYLDEDCEGEEPDA